MQGSISLTNWTTNSSKNYDNHELIVKYGEYAYNFPVKRDKYLHDDISNKMLENFPTLRLNLSINSCRQMGGRQISKRWTFHRKINIFFSEKSPNLWKGVLTWDISLLHIKKGHLPENVWYIESLFGKLKDAVSIEFNLKINFTCHLNNKIWFDICVKTRSLICLVTFALWFSKEQNELVGLQTKIQLFLQQKSEQWFKMYDVLYQWHLEKSSYIHHKLNHSGTKTKSYAAKKPIQNLS